MKLFNRFMKWAGFNRQQIKEIGKHSGPVPVRVPTPVQKTPDGVVDNATRLRKYQRWRASYNAMQKESRRVNR